MRWIFGAQGVPIPAKKKPQRELTTDELWRAKAREHNARFAAKQRRLAKEEPHG